jgi:hypothetical protein
MVHSKGCVRTKEPRGFEETRFSEISVELFLAPGTTSSTDDSLFLDVGWGNCELRKPKLLSCKLYLGMTDSLVSRMINNQSGIQAHYQPTHLGFGQRLKICVHIEKLNPMLRHITKIEQGHRNIFHVAATNPLARARSMLFGLTGYSDHLVFACYSEDDEYLDAWMQLSLKLNELFEEGGSVSKKDMNILTYTPGHPACTKALLHSRKTHSYTARFHYASLVRNRERFRSVAQASALV